MVVLKFQVCDPPIGSPKKLLWSLETPPRARGTTGSLGEALVQGPGVGCQGGFAGLPKAQNWSSDGLALSIVTKVRAVDLFRRDLYVV